MTRRSAIKPVYAASEPEKPETVAQKHKFMVVSVHKDRPNDTRTNRFSNVLAAEGHVKDMALLGYFARIV